MIGDVLPIDAVLPELVVALGVHTRAVLHAPPGAGKTTRVPLALRDEGWLDGRRIIMLEPRRVAARAAASYMARLLDDAVGGTVGYRIRLDTRVTARTRIEIVTEGVLTRMLQEDPSLEGTGLIIFDEFHERSIHADTALALSLQAQSLFRPDLRLLVMSATLDIDTVAAVLEPAPVIRSEGRAYPVETVYLNRRIDGHVEAAVAATVARAHDSHDGDILVFLPGVAEIRRTADHLAGAGFPGATRVIPLYGDLSQQDQDAAIAPSPAGLRKIVLATAIAETSLTIDGVRTVIDSGLMRVPRFSARTGMTRLHTVPVSRAAADQRRGRAGRLGPGTCFRMWTEGDHAALLEHRPPEIMDADLAPLALELAAWGVTNPSELRWIDEPPAAAYSRARALLRDLDALDEHGALTAHGREMSALSAHPRVAHLLLRARALDCVAQACDIAALLGERDVLRTHDGGTDPDLRLRLPLLHGDNRPPPGHRIDHAALHRARAEARQWRQRLRVHSAKPDSALRGTDESVAILLAFAYPDRIAQQRGARGSFVLRSGAGVTMDAQHNMAGEEMIVAADLGGHGRTARVFLAAPISRVDVESHFAEHIATALNVSYDVDAGTLRARHVRRLGAIVFGERSAGGLTPADAHTALLDAVRQHGLDILPWTDPARALRSRLAFLHAFDESWPDVANDALLDSIADWLLPWLGDGTRPDALRRVDMVEALLSLAGWQRRPDIDRLAPTHAVVPSGSRIAIDYADPAAPLLAVRLQEMFGATATPCIADGRVPLTLHLLSPARRPVQVTRDLASFWRSAYFDVRRDLRGRYPKHYWPDDPLVAEPTRRTRPPGG